MPKPDTLFQPVTFDPSECKNDCLPLIIGQLGQCPGIANPQFLGSPVDNWSQTASTTITTVSNNPLRVSCNKNFSITTAQTKLSFSPGEHRIQVQIQNHDAGRLQVNVFFQGLTTLLNYYTSPVFFSDGPGIASLDARFTIPDDYDQLYILRIVTGTANGTNPAVQQDQSYLLAQICPLNADTDQFCFQLPLFPEGDEILSFTNNVVDFDAEFTNTTAYNNPRNTTGSPTLCGSPFDDNTNPNGTPPTAANVISGSGKRFHEATLGDVSITYGINYFDHTVGKLSLSPQTSETASFLGDRQDFTEGDANSTLFWKGTRDWDASAASVMEMYILSTSECDDTNEHVQHDITLNEYSVYPAFYETTFTGASDTFYRLQFDLAKTSGVRVTISDSYPTVIFDAYTTNPIFDKVFLTGTLPSTTLTIRFEIDDLTEWPTTGFNESVLQNVSLYKYCKWDVDLEDQSANVVDNLAQTHATVNELSSTVSYNRNIQYCLDIGAQDAGCYYFRAENQCDTNETWLSNCVQICDDSCDVSMISWDHGNIKFTGVNQLDLLNYSYTPYLYVKVDFQDLTSEWEGIYYNDAAGYLQNPYSFVQNTKVMQIWPLPGFARKALAQALTDQFYVDGELYRKYDDESITPQFNAVERSATRIIVHKVGDFLQSRNS